MDPRCLACRPERRLSSRGRARNALTDDQKIRECSLFAQLRLLDGRAGPHFLARGTHVTVSGFITAIVIGAIIGALGRLFAPG